VLRNIFQANDTGETSRIVENGNGPDPSFFHKEHQMLHGIPHMDGYRSFQFEIIHRCRQTLYLAGDGYAEAFQDKTRLFIDLSGPGRGKKKPLVGQVLEMRIAYSRADRIGVGILVSKDIDNLIIPGTFIPFSFL